MYEINEGDRVILKSLENTSELHGVCEEMYKIGDSFIVDDTSSLYVYDSSGYTYSKSDLKKDTTQDITDHVFGEGTDNKKKASETQIAGNHYSKLKIQPMRYALENELNYGQANAVKYITRYKDKNGIEDLKKAIHCIELLIEFEESVDKE